jgi:RNA polymerase sigma factor (sigma-70 family)
MTPSNADRLIQEAVEGNHLSLAALDAVLEDDAKFDDYVEKLNGYLEDGFVIEAPDDRPKLDAEALKNGNGKAVATPRQNAYLQYLKELRRWPRMTREEEYLFAKRMEFFRRRLVAVLDALKLPPDIVQYFLRSGAEGCCGRKDCASHGPACEAMVRCPRGKVGQVQANCRAYNKCRSIFVQRNLYLVSNLARHYKTYGIPMMDLVQEGNAALIRAVEKFDWRKQVRFQTYAEFWIRQAVERTINNNKQIVNVPIYIQQKMRRLKREGKLSVDDARLSAKDISEAFELSNEVAGRILETVKNHFSLDMFVPGEDDMKLADLVAWEGEEVTSEEEVEALKQNLYQALDTLTEKERTVIKHRFGMDGAKVMTMSELGQMLNVSRERVRQVQLRSLQKLQKPKFRKTLSAFL